MAAILAGVALATLFMIWPLQYQTGWVRSRGEVTKVYVDCGEPWAILVNGSSATKFARPGSSEQCVRKARTRPLNIPCSQLPLLGVGIAGVLRGPYNRIPLLTSCDRCPNWGSGGDVDRSLSHP